MKKYIILSVLLAVLLSSCKKEQALEASKLDKNFLSVKDNPNDPVDHEIYNIYVKYGVPIFYNDTVSTEVRFDASGKQFNYYEILAVNYVIASSAAPTPTNNPDTYAIPRDKSKLLPIITFLRDEVISKLPRGIYVPSVLLLDSLYSESAGSYAIRGLNTVGVSKASQFDTLSREERNKLRGAALRSMVSSFITSEANATWLSTSFFSVSRAIYTPRDVYSSGFNLFALVDAYNLTGLTTYEELGFIGVNPIDFGYLASPTSGLDLNQYLDAVFEYSTAEFTAKYGDYAPVMLKYNRLKAKLTEIGFTLN